MNIQNILNKMKRVISLIKNNENKNVFKPSYRVVEIIQEEDNEYIVKIQLINKNVLFKTKPEELLAQDKIVDQFSPRDIRTLTYLGYLGINAPKYKILAKHLLDNDNKLSFSIREKGNKKVMTKTADEILHEKEILESLSAKDAHLVGYTVASENIIAEKNQKQAAIRQLIDKQNEKKTVDSAN